MPSIAPYTDLHSPNQSMKVNYQKENPSMKIFHKRKIISFEPFFTVWLPRKCGKNKRQQEFTLSVAKLGRENFILKKKKNGKKSP
jgi:hypothetical protein